MSKGYTKQHEKLWVNWVKKKSERKLIEKIRDICSTNADADWLENDPSEEFAEIVKLIDESNQ